MSLCHRQSLQSRGAAVWSPQNIWSCSQNCWCQQWTCVNHQTLLKHNWLCPALCLQSAAVVLKLGLDSFQMIHIFDLEKTPCQMPFPTQPSLFNVQVARGEHDSLTKPRASRGFKNTTSQRWQEADRLLLFPVRKKQLYRVIWITLLSKMWKLWSQQICFRSEVTQQIHADFWAKQLLETNRLSQKLICTSLMAFIGLIRNQWLYRRFVLVKSKPQRHKHIENTLNFTEILKKKTAWFIF